MPCCSSSVWMRALSRVGSGPSSWSALDAESFQVLSDVVVAGVEIVGDGGDREAVAVESHSLLGMFHRERLTAHLDTSVVEQAKQSALRKFILGAQRGCRRAGSVLLSDLGTGLRAQTSREPMRWRRLGRRWIWDARCCRGQLSEVRRPGRDEK